MHLQSLLAAFCLLMGSYSQETDPLPEEDPKHFGDQDATKVVVLTGQHWVKRRTYNVSSQRGDPKCEYAQIVGIADGEREKNYTLQLGARFKQTWIRKNQTLVLMTSGNHTEPNVMQFARSSVDGRQEHKLLYSNYENCSIVRIKRKDDGLFCDLLLLGSAANSEPPTPCNEKFDEYCKGEKVEVYSRDCTTQQK